VVETNVILDSPKIALYEAGKGLRVRRARDAAGDAVTQTVTFKGPRRPGPLKSREEIELTVSGGNAQHLLEQIGFAPALSFEKRRESWELDGCKVELDELPLLGRFVEIEGPTEEPVLRLRERLGLAAHPMIKSGYVELLMTFLETHDLREREIRFPKA
jgi:adenylate cyclase class 2